jgi:hypothetical protein
VKAGSAPKHAPRLPARAGPPFGWRHPPDTAFGTFPSILTTIPVSLFAGDHAHLRQLAKLLIAIFVRAVHVTHGNQRLVKRQARAAHRRWRQVPTQREASPLLIILLRQLVEVQVLPLPPPCHVGVARVSGTASGRGGAASIRAWVRAIRRAEGAEQPQGPHVPCGAATGTSCAVRSSHEGVR